MPDETIIPRSAVREPLLNDDGSLKLKNKRIVLLLQGGGALGAYQVGAYDALSSECEIDWVGGISIGGINAGLIAGSPKGAVLQALRAFWADILSEEHPPYDWTQWWNNWWTAFPALKPPRLGALVPKYCFNFAWEATFGQKNFFNSRMMSLVENPFLRQWLIPLTQNEASFYDTQPLREKLTAYLGGAEINTNGMRLSLGTTRVTDGEVMFFNNFSSANKKFGSTKDLTVEHILASGALPPAFPAIRIDGDWYWDGGVSSNTPIEALRKDLVQPKDPQGIELPTEDTLVFLVDLWDRKGALPRSFDEVFWRQKSIQFGSRKRSAERVVERYDDRPGIPNPPTLEICQVMFERPAGDPEFTFSDADFSRDTFDTMYRLGFADMNLALRQPIQVYPNPQSGAPVKHAVLYRYGTFGKHLLTDF